MSIELLNSEITLPAVLLLRSSLSPKILKEHHSSQTELNSRGSPSLSVTENIHLVKCLEPYLFVLCACMCFCMPVEVRGRCLGVSSLLPPCALEFHLKPSLPLCDDPRRFTVFFFLGGWGGRLKFCNYCSAKDCCYF